MIKYKWFTTIKNDGSKVYKRDIWYKIRGKKLWDHKAKYKTKDKDIKDKKYLIIDLEEL